MTYSAGNNGSAVVEAARAHDTGTAAVIGTDIAGTILYWNDGAADLYGWEAQDAIGQNILDITPTRNSTDAATQIMEDLRDGHEWTGEFIVRRRDGTPIIAHVTNHVVREKEVVIGVVGISQRAAPAGDTATRVAE